MNTLEDKIDEILRDAFVGLWTKDIDGNLIEIHDKFDVLKNALKTDIAALISQVENEARNVTGETSDGYHTFDELYDYRRVYNAALFNEWALQGKFDVHKSYKHSDGELCFGGGWFVAVAELPTGQVTNHYENKYWNDFQIPEKVVANTYDGHSPKEALDRIATLQAKEQE